MGTKKEERERNILTGRSGGPEKPSSVINYGLLILFIRGRLNWELRHGDSSLGGKDRSR